MLGNPVFFLSFVFSYIFFLFVSVISVKEAQDILDKKEEACGSRSVEGSKTTQSPPPTGPVNIEHRKILTPKGRFFMMSLSLL